jgi:hypothetical protein
MMIHSKRLKTALLAAASFTAAAGVAAHAAPVPHNQPPAIEHVMTVADHGDSEKAAAPQTARTMTLWAAAAGVLAALAGAIGFKRLAAAAKSAGPIVAKAARATVEAPVKAARYVARSVSAPIRYALAMASLALVAFTGIGVYDVEWIGGLVVGIALTMLAWAGAGRLRKRAVVRHSRAPQTRVNE